MFLCILAAFSAFTLSSDNPAPVSDVPPPPEPSLLTWERNALRLGGAYDSSKADGSLELVLETNVALNLSEPESDKTAFRLWFRGANRLNWNGDDVSLRGLDRLALEVPGKLPLLGGVEFFALAPVNEERVDDPTLGVRFKPGKLLEETGVKFDCKFIEASANAERIDLGSRFELDLASATGNLLPQGTVLDFTLSGRYVFDDDRWSSTVGGVVLFRDAFGKQIDPFVGVRVSDFEASSATFLIGVEFRF